MPALSESFQSLLPGFEDPVHDAQAVFRKTLEAMSRPGRIVDLNLPLRSPDAVHPAFACLCLTLFDADTPVWLDRDLPRFREWLSFHTGCPLTPHPEEAAFALVTEGRAELPWEAFPRGSHERPEISATLLIQVESFDKGTELKLSGPGIRNVEKVQVKGLSSSFFQHRNACALLFPMGIDCFFVSGTRFMGLPRTTGMEVGSCMSR